MNPDTGSLQGLTMTNLTRANLCRAVVEGTTFGLRYGLDLLRQTGLQSQSIRLIGGGSKSPLWRQMVADIMHTEVVCTEQSEAAALGAAIQAAWCQSGESLASLCDKCVSIDPASRSIAAGDELVMVYPADGTSCVPDGCAILKGAPHEENAKLFVDFTVSLSVQKLLQERF